MRPAPRPPPAFAEAVSSLDRRGFLRLAGAAAALGLLPTGCGPRREWAPPGDLELTALSPRGYATLNAAAARLLGPSAEAWIAQRRVDPAARADAWLRHTPGLGAVLGQGLALLEFGCWPLLPKLRRFSALSGADRDAVLASCMASRFDVKRDLFRGVKSVAALAFYGDPATQELVGYPGPFGSPAEIAAAMTYPAGDPAR